MIKGDSNVSMEDISITENNKLDDNHNQKAEKLFTLKKWNAVAVWSWDVTCDTCLICSVPVIDPCLECQSLEKKEDPCVVVWGECNHSYHNCCMARWLKQGNNNCCPYCRHDWIVQRIGK